jgi:hypothetical protein
MGMCIQLKPAAIRQNVYFSLRPMQRPRVSGHRRQGPAEQDDGGSNQKEDQSKQPRRKRLSGGDGLLRWSREGQDGDRSSS